VVTLGEIDVVVPSLVSVIVALSDASGVDASGGSG
jgi:hypothetical protein